MSIKLKGLRGILKERDMKMRDLSNKTGITYGTISKLCRESIGAGPKVVEKLCIFFNVTEKELCQQVPLKKEKRKYTKRKKTAASPKETKANEGDLASTIESAIDAGTKIAYVLKLHNEKIQKLSSEFKKMRGEFIKAHSKIKELKEAVAAIDEL